MEILLKGILAFFWLVLIPSMVGVSFLRNKNTITLSESFLAGYLFLFSVTEILTLPMICLEFPLHILSSVFGLISVCAAVVGTCCWFCYWKKKKAGTGLKKKKEKKNRPVWYWIAVLVIIAQTAVCMVYTHFDADDALFIGTATTAVETNTIYSINPYTGAEYEVLPSRYVLSPFPIFLAVISELCNGLHPAIIAHVFFAGVFLVMAYLVQYLLGKKWFPANRDAQGIYLFFSAVLSWFSAYSIYNAGNFQMIRIWQGKAFLAAVLLPLILYLGYSVMIQQEKEYSWLLLGMAMISCCLVSSMGIILGPLLLGILALVSLIYCRKISVLPKAAACCIPCGILGVIYILIR